MRIASLIVTLTVAASLAASPTAFATPTQAQLQKDRAENAEKAYRGAVVALKSGKATSETVYVWSVRWLDSDFERATVAKAKKQALVDHAARMLELEAEAVKQRDAGTLSATDATAATYFRIEADLWVLRGKPH